jgi:hypothetical protein
LKLAADGALTLQTADGVLQLLRPRAWQESNGQRQEIECHYRLLGGTQVGFVVGAHDPTRPLVIDPVLLYSTYLGGTSGESAFGVAVDQGGSAYVVGTTFSTDFPGSSPIKQTKTANNQDAFVLKLNPSGTALSYGTWLGGSNNDLAQAVTVDQQGNAYVTGYTFSSDFPTTPGALRTGSGPTAHAFVTKLNASGSALIYSALVGGNNQDIAYGIAVDKDGNAYFAGATQSSDLPGTGV